MVPEAGYWRPSRVSDIFIKCPFSDSCLGSDTSEYETGECLDGYIGNLCSI